MIGRPAGMDWREVAKIVLDLDVAQDPDRTKRVWESHLARGQVDDHERLSPSSARRRASLPRVRSFRQTQFAAELDQEAEALERLAATALPPAAAPVQQQSIEAPTQPELPKRKN